MSPNSLSNEAWLLRFKDDLLKQGYHSQTVQRYLAVTRRFLQYLREQDIALEAVRPEILDNYFRLQSQIYQPHTLRHARAVSLLRGAIPLKTIGDILGHKSTVSTRPYLKLATEDLRAVGLEVPKGEGVQR